ncbi:MAG: Ktr system potassium transporter B, partial [Hyphomicrobiales bacterium]|nr:Ktr system potassium transporter B [Hyphomicrobiales bacterium]
MAIKLRIVRVPPPAGLALLYALFITLGAATLKLPWAATAPISWSDAIFTATSAVTVTGLVVFDPGAQLTWFGQCVVMLLIQLGGLGLMTFAVLILGFLGFPVGLPQRFFLKEE